MDAVVKIPAAAHLLFLCWDATRMRAEERERRLLDTVAPALVAAGAETLRMNIVDSAVVTRSPAPWRPWERPLTACVVLRPAGAADPDAFVAPLRAAGFSVHGYRVAESVYTDYGRNRHSGPRTWPDGQRSPGVMAVTLLIRPRRLVYDEWMRRWWGRQSPVSEAMQPRQRYVRNVITAALTPNALDYAGVVEEVWPSPRHVHNWFLFFGAANVWQLLRNLWTMWRSVTGFLQIGKIRTTMMSEWLLRG